MEIAENIIWSIHGCMTDPDWNLFRAFHATAIAGSLTAAARKLGLTQPTLSRQVLALEDRLGVTLFERPGRKLVLTQTGQKVLEHIRTMGDAAQAASLAASGQLQELSGRVRISASDSVAAYLLPEITERLRLEAPGLTIEIDATNELSDLHQMEADIAIRHMRPDRIGLNGHHVRDTEACFYASESWLANNAQPESLAGLANACLIGFGDTARYATYLRSSGIPIDVGGFRLASSSSVVIWEMVKRGLGVAPMLRDIAELTPGLVQLLPDHESTSVPIWLVTHEALLASPRIRLVHQILSQELDR